MAETSAEERKKRRAEIADYARRGAELALAWKLYDRAYAEMQADLHQRQLRQSPWRCKKCKQKFLSLAELRAHRRETHDDFVPPDYVGVVINPMSERVTDRPQGKFTLRDLRRR